MQFKFKPGRPIFRFLAMNIGLVLVVLILFMLSNKKFPGIGIILGVLLATRIPIVIIFIQYYVNDYKSQFIFEKSKNKIIYNRRTKNRTFTINQIKLIRLTAPASRLRKDGISLFLADDFFFYEFFFTDGQSIILTSLILKGKLINEANFKSSNFEKQRKFFSFLPGES